MLDVVLMFFFFLSVFSVMLTIAFKYHVTLDGQFDTFIETIQTLYVFGLTSDNHVQGVAETHMNNQMWDPQPERHMPGRWPVVYIVLSYATQTLDRAPCCGLLKGSL